MFLKTLVSQVITPLALLN